MVEVGKQASLAVKVHQEMTPKSSYKVLWWMAAGCICVVFLSLLPILLSPEQPSGTLDLRVADTPQMTNGAMLVTLVLSNGTSRQFNIVDDTAGKPFFVLDDGTGGPGKSTIGVGLSRIANLLKINLAPGEALTNTILLTNPPPRFRLLVEARDLAAERRTGVKQVFLILASKVTLHKPVPYANTTITLPASSWIDAGAISTTTQGVAAQTPKP
jgi:hypothetical protein